MDFEWDAAKATANRRKHGVSFDEAATVFEDPNVVVRYDDEHSDREDRWAVVGLSSRGRLLVVTYTPREEVVRIITARLATRPEVEEYAKV